MSDIIHNIINNFTIPYNGVFIFDAAAHKTNKNANY